MLKRTIMRIYATYMHHESLELYRTYALNQCEQYITHFKLKNPKLVKIEIDSVNSNANDTSYVYCIEHDVED